MLIYSSARCHVRRHGEGCPNQGCADARGALDRDAAGPQGTSLVSASTACSAGLIRSYTIVDYKLEQYFSLTPNQPAVDNL